MPIYEYKCLACGTVKGLLVQGFKDPEGLACEACGSADLKRIISRTNYHQSHSAGLIPMTRVPGIRRAFSRTHGISGFMQSICFGSQG